MRQTQIIAAALILGVIGFAAVVCVMVPWKDAIWTMSLLSAIALLFGISMFPVALVVPRITARTGTKAVALQLSERGLSADDPQAIGQLAGLSTAITIIFFALIEGAIFFNLLIFMIDHRLPNLIFVALATAVLVMFFPTGDRIVSWVENRWDDLKYQMKSAAGENVKAR